MKIINVYNCNNYVINMSKRVKIKLKVRGNVGIGMMWKNVDDKESVDCIVVVEVMLCFFFIFFILLFFLDVIVKVVMD